MHKQEETNTVSRQNLAKDKVLVRREKGVPSDYVIRVAAATGKQESTLFSRYCTCTGYMYILNGISMFTNFCCFANIK